MKISLFSLFDTVANQFGSPFAAVNAESALRSCVSESKNPASGPLHSHPHDFRVFFLGVFDNESGEFAPAGVPQFVGNVAVLLTQE